MKENANPPDARIPSPDMRAALQARADGESTLRFDAFVDVALYAPEVGYYRREKTRVAYGEEGDFYTNSSLRPVFAPLVKAAAAALLPSGVDPAAYTFVEFGSEPGQPLFENPAPFRAYEGIGVATLRERPLPERCIVFSNELFDAQPFRRFRQTATGWREIGVFVDHGPLREILFDPGEPLPTSLPANAPEGYTLDWPEAAVALAETICAPGWKGVFLAFDYGLDEEVLLHDRPDGTARAYFQHRQGNDLLAHPGKQDLTCHVNWTGLAAALRAQGFAAVTLSRQEAFFMHHATKAIEEILMGAKTGVDRDRQRLKELLHPHYFGSRFQVLHGCRFNRSM